MPLVFVTGWYTAHAALRLDMSDFSRLLLALDDQVTSGKLNTFPLEWQAKAILTWWKEFEFIFHLHHKKEDELLFPAIEERVKLPMDKMSKGRHTDLHNLKF